MHMKCPICGAAIPAGQINIQELIAVCPACDHVFTFNRDAVARKAKRSKLKTPNRVQVSQDDHQLTLSYQRVFGPGPKFGIVMASIALFAYTAMALGAARDGAPQGVLVVFGALALLMVYFLAVIFTTTTRVLADEDGIEVTSGPLPFPIKDDKTLSNEIIAHVAFEKTQEVIPPGMPTHNVYAELHGGERVNVVTSLPREHARFLAATLDDYLRALDAAEIVIEGVLDDVMIDDVTDGDEVARWAESDDATDGELDAAIVQAEQSKPHNRRAK